MRKKFFVNTMIGISLLVFAPKVLAANVEIVGHVANPSNLTQGSKVQFSNPSTHAVVGTTTVDPNGLYSISLPEGTYDITVVPPAQSGLEQTTIHNNTFHTDGTATTILPSAPSSLYASNLGLDIALGVATLLVGSGLGYLFWRRR